MYAYPDLLVVCGEPQFADDHKDTLTNPTVVFEVLSESIQDYDRGRKFEHYQTLPSLIEYLTVAQSRPHSEHWTRGENGGRLVEYGDVSQTIQLSSLGAALPLSEIYDKIEFDR